MFALTGDFVYLTNDMGLYVDGYFVKQDVRWTDADLAKLTHHLRDNGIKVVIHKWQPSEAIQNAVRAAGAELVVLDAGDPGVVVDRALAPDGLQQILREEPRGDRRCCRRVAATRSRKEAASSHVNRADHSAPTPVQDVGIDHCGFHVRVAEQFLHGTNVVARLQQVCREGMA